MEGIARIMAVALGGLTALSLAGLVAFGSVGSHNAGTTLSPAPLMETGPKPEFGDWFVFNPDEVGHWPVDANGNPLEVGGSMPFRIAESNYVLGTAKRVPAGTPLIYPLNDRIVVQLYGSSTPDCQPRVKSADSLSSLELNIVQDDLFEDTLGCDGVLAPKAFDLFPTQYPDSEFWRDPNQVADWLHNIATYEPTLIRTRQMLFSPEYPEGLVTEFGTILVADSISHCNTSLAEDFAGGVGALTSIETDGVDAVSDDGGHIVCRFGQPCVSVDEFGNETELVLDQGICNDDGCETPSATE